MPDYPTRRPTDADRAEEVEVPSSLLNLPWIDAHNHAHTLSWGDRERYALAGCRAMVTVAGGYHWTPYRPVAPEDIRYLWDDAIARRGAIERSHLFEVGLAVGVHTGVRVSEPERLLDAMGEYCALEEVVAVGETGITPTQHTSRWGLEGQRAVVGGQMELAAEHDLPVLLHTPSSASAGGGRERRPGLGLPGYEKDTSLGTEPVLSGDDAAVEAARIDVELAREAGVPDEHVVASHASPETLPYLMEETGCYASVTVGYGWLHGIAPADVAEAIETYGPERIVLDTDAANVLRSDVLSVKRAALDLYRLGVEEDAIRQVAFENPAEVFGIGGEG